MVAEIGVWGLHVLSSWDLDCEESAEKSRGTGVMFWDTWGGVSRWTLIVNVRLSSVYGSSDQPFVRGWGITFVEALRYGMRGLGNLDDFLTN